MEKKLDKIHINLLRLYNPLLLFKSIYAVILIYKKNEKNVDIISLLKKQICQ